MSSGGYYYHHNAGTINGISLAGSMKRADSPGSIVPANQLNCGHQARQAHCCSSSAQ
nr:hypothetical protein [uncultured Treponema sp.]